MTQLDQALLGLKEHPGVEHLVLAGMDGLLVHHVGEAAALDADRVAAMVPAVASASARFARAANGGHASTIVLELGEGVAIVLPLSSELLLVALLRSGVGFAPLLGELRRDRGRLVQLV